MRISDWSSDVCSSDLRRVPEVGRHAHFGDAHRVRREHVVMHVAAREDFAEQMAHLFADAQHPDRRSLVLFGCLHFAFSSSSSFATMRAIERMLRAVPLQPKRLSMKGPVSLLSATPSP